MSNAQIEKQLAELNRKMDLLLNQKFGASQTATDGLLQERKSPVSKRQPKKSAVIDFKTMYRKRGIV